MRKIISLGETLRLYVTYTDINTGELVDPTSIAATIVQPDGTLVLIGYPDPDFVRDSQGQYYIRVSGNIPGTHVYRIVADLNISDKDVRDGRFDVEATP